MTTEGDGDQLGLGRRRGAPGEYMNLVHGKAPQQTPRWAACTRGRAAPGGCACLCGLHRGRLLRRRPRAQTRLSWLWPSKCLRETELGRNTVWLLPESPEIPATGRSQRLQRLGWELS